MVSFSVSQNVLLYYIHSSCDDVRWINVYMIRWNKVNDVLWSMCVLSHFSCVWLFVTPMDCIPPDSPVHGILQARILEWVAMPFSRGSSWSRNGTWVSCIADRFFTLWATRASDLANCKHLPQRKSKLSIKTSFHECSMNAIFPEIL